MWQTCCVSGTKAVEAPGSVNMDPSLLPASPPRLGHSPSRVLQARAGGTAMPQALCVQLL